MFSCDVMSSFMETSVIPIAIVTVISKLLELCLSKILNKYVCTSENYLALKTNLLLIYAYIYTVKSVIKYYKYFSSPIFT